MEVKNALIRGTMLGYADEEETDNRRIILEYRIQEFKEGFNESNIE